MKLYGPVFAVLLARWIGHREPLIARLRDPAEPLTQPERDYLADVLAGTEPRWPTPGQVAESRKKLERAAHYLEFLNASGRPGKKMAALEYAVRECKVNRSTVQRSVKYAERLADGKWWAATSRLARKRKIASLHRTY